MYSETNKTMEASLFPEKNIISHQFIKAARQLIADKVVLDQKELCTRYNYDKSFFNKVAKGEQSVPYDVLYQFVLDYNLNPSYFFPKLKNSESLYLR